MYANHLNFRVVKEIGVEEHDGDVRFYTGSGNMAVSCMRNAFVIIRTVCSLWTRLWQIPRSTERISSYYYYCYYIHISGTTSNDVSVTVVWIDSYISTRGFINIATVFLCPHPHRSHHHHHHCYCCWCCGWCRSTCGMALELLIHTRHGAASSPSGTVADRRPDMALGIISEA